MNLDWEALLTPLMENFDGTLGLLVMGFVALAAAPVVVKIGLGVAAAAIHKIQQIFS